MDSGNHKRVHKPELGTIDSSHARTSSLAAAGASSGQNTAVDQQRDIERAPLFTRRQNTVLLSTMILLGALLFVDVFLQLNTPHSFVMLLLLIGLGGSYAFTVRAWSGCCRFPTSRESTPLED